MENMVEVQKFKNLPEECLLNISSYLLGTPQQLKFKHNKALKQIQNKYKLDIFNFTEDEEFYDDDENEPYRELRYGYGIRNNNYTIEDTLKIIKRQCHKLKSMVQPDGDTHLSITYNYYLNGEEDKVEFSIEDIDYTTVEGLLEYMTIRTNSIQRMINGYTATEREVKFRSVWFHLLNIQSNFFN